MSGFAGRGRRSNSEESGSTMRLKRISAVLHASAAALALAACSSGADEAGEGEAQTASAECDRACLLDATNAYLEALASGEPDGAPLAENVRFVENLQALEPGEGLWSTATGGMTDFEIIVPDTELQQVGLIGVMERADEPVVVAMRLKFEGGEITEAEHIVTPPAQGNMTNLARPRAGLLEEIPADQRLEHDDLIRIGATYYDALDNNDGSLMQFAPDCQRIENGMITAGEGIGPPPNAEPGAARTATDCAGQLDSQAFVYIDRIDNRRMIAADPVTGLAMGFSHFRHPMDNLPYQVTNSDGSVSERNRENFTNDPFDMPAAHIFKILPDGRVREIEAVGVVMPYNSPTGWE
jgi:hypothetical protein